MYHDIEREPVSFFLREVNQKKLSGHLFVSAKDFQITLNLLEGKLANGMSTRFDEKLSVILHLMGGINEEQYNFLSGLHQFSDDQVAGILLDQNFAKKKDIYYARIYQLRRIAISTFALEQGKWIFTAGEADPPLRETFDIPLAGILVEGARSIDHVSVYASRWQHCIPVLFKEIPLDAEIYYTDAEREFYAAVQALGQQSCQELIARLNLVPIEFWRRLLAFHLLGIVEFAKSEESPDLTGEIAALLELNRRLQEAPGAGAALLGLPASAPAADFEKARAGFLARFAPERFGSGAAPEIKSIARAVCLHLRELTPGRAPWPDASTRPGLWREEATASGTPPAPAVSKPLREEKIASKPAAGIHIELPAANIFGEAPSGFKLEELTAEDIVFEPPAEVQIERPGVGVGGGPIAEPRLPLLRDEEIVRERSTRIQTELPAELVGGRGGDEPHLLSLQDGEVDREPSTEVQKKFPAETVGGRGVDEPHLLSLRDEEIIRELSTEVQTEFPAETVGGRGVDEPHLLSLRDEDIIVAMTEPPTAARAGDEWVIDAVEQAGPELLREEDIVADGATGNEPELLGEAELIAEPEAPLVAAPTEAEPLSGAEWIIDENEADEPARPGASPAVMPLQVEPEIASAAPPREFAPLAAPPSLRMANADHEKAWQLLLQAKELYERHEYASAVPLLKKAIKLEPGQGDFYYLLGICQNESELSKNEAEMNLKKAIELKSWSADPVYALGVLYRGQGKMKLAERCFQRVKEIAYEHTGASRALVDLRRQKAGKPFSPHAKKRR